MHLTFLVILLVVCAAGFGASWRQAVRRAEAAARAESLTGGSHERGKVVARELGCVACHIMPGIRGPESRVGPPLEDFAKGQFVAGAADNTPENVMRFLRNPRSVAPKSAMPDVHATEAQARDLAAYLFAQR